MFLPPPKRPRRKKIGRILFEHQGQRGRARPPTVHGAATVRLARRWRDACALPVTRRWARLYTQACLGYVSVRQNLDDDAETEILFCSAVERFPEADPERVKSWVRGELRARGLAGQQRTGMRGLYHECLVKRVTSRRNWHYRTRAGLNKAARRVIILGVTPY